MDKLTPEQQTHISLLKTKLQNVGTKIKAIVEQGRQIEADPSQLFLFKGMYRELKPYFDSFNKIWDSIIEYVFSLDLPSLYPTKEDRSLQHAVERYYYEGQAIYEQYMNPTPLGQGSSALPNRTVTDETRTIRAKLPQINLPTFNGNQVEWPLFRDTYRSLIHDEPTLSDIEKFLFLISCLSGPARALVQGIHLQEENYMQAWALLNDTYNDKRRLASGYLKAILEFAPFKTRPSANGLKYFLTVVGESINSFKLLKIPNEGDFLLFTLVLRCLDIETRKAFEKKHSNNDLPSYKDIIDFLKVEWRSLDLTSDEHDRTLKGHSSPKLSLPLKAQGLRTNTLLVGSKSTSSRKGNVQVNPSKKNLSEMACPVCKKIHSLYHCDLFRRMSPNEKIASLKGWEGCCNCLSVKHNTRNCISQRVCRVCGQRHHSWLHQTSGTENKPAVDSISQQPDAVTLGGLNSRGEVLLGTAIVEMLHHNGTYKPIRIVTDSGSQHSFITESCAKSLGLKIEPCSESISGIGQVPLASTLGKSICKIRPKGLNRNSQLTTTAIVVPRITSELPQSAVPVLTQTHLQSYILADPDYWKPGRVDFLLGGDLFYDIIIGRPIHVSPSIPKLLPTIFGYIVGGPVKSMSSHTSNSLFVHSEDNLKDAITRFWEVEEVSSEPIISPDEMKAEQHFTSTHYRTSTGRYVVALPTIGSISSLGNARHTALKRFLNLESKLAKDTVLKQEYDSFMQEYIDLGHMKAVPFGSGSYIIPHHPVVKWSGGKMKLRVVFDASCQTSTGSLNDYLLGGPKLQLDIGDIITNFRTHQFVMTADIVKMYRQICVHQPDCKYQHIFWRFNPTEEIQEYELCTVTYGEKSSPFLALRTIQQLVTDEGISFPKAASALTNDIYVDDVATGSTTVSDAMRLKDELIALLDKGGFQLSKWASNCPEIIHSLQSTPSGVTSVSLGDKEDHRLKLLGIQWDPSEDTFSYELSAPSAKPTKRTILSAIARIYDPLGFLSPAVFLAKTIFKETWAAKCGWDAEIPFPVATKWNLFISQLSYLSNKVKIPRCITLTGEASYTIVGFSDASIKGYAAVLYLQTRTEDKCQVNLIKAKTKLAPNKPLLTIPRLELCGALLLSRLFKSCNNLMSNLPVTHVRFFCDSAVVLSWLSTPPEKLKTFVAHRVVDILELTSGYQWSYVATDDNPADCSSRGVYPQDLPNHPLWWAGPAWLTQSITEWPSLRVNVNELPELKGKETTSLTARVEKTSSSIVTWMEHFSSFPKLLRSLSYAIRFLKRVRHEPTPTGAITVTELREVTQLCIKLVQHFYMDLDNLNSSKALLALRPFCDEKGLVRVGGRIDYSSTLSYDMKHPYILPGESHFAKIMVDYYHRTFLHLGPTALRCMLQSRYWITGARQLIRKRIFQCVTCFKTSRSPNTPLMGNLPSCRLDEGQVFINVGIDFAGPFFIKESLRRKAALGKCYLCLFICMATKAVHLEAVTKCTTDAFLAAFERFIGRRGKPRRVFSDCGTNFVGAANRLRELLVLMRSKETKDQILNHTVPYEIQWSFNPPSSPHFGGLWEAGIKSCKTVMYKVIGDTALTFEELSTLFCRIEGILNSRPLAPQTSDPDNLDCLTPGHFLIGRPIAALPEAEEQTSHISIHQRWKLVQDKTKHFWTRWRLEYLNHLQQRRKWRKDMADLKVGDLVILKDPNCPQRTWPLARVVATHPGRDGIVRVVTIRTSCGDYVRPAAKLVPLNPVNASK